MKHLTRPLGLGVLFAFTLLLGSTVPLAKAGSPQAAPPAGLSSVRQPSRQE
jgi:hypothetical protein